MDDSVTTTFASQWDSTIEVLEQCLTELRRIAPVTSPTQIREVFSRGKNGGSKLVLCELIKFDLAAAAEVGVNRDLNFYLSEFAFELPAADVPADLVLEELQTLRESGVEPDIAEYIERFPHLREILPTWATIKNNATCRPLAAAASAPPQLAIGSLIADFRILRHVGKGAFANVYMALQETLQRLVALKVSLSNSEEPQTLSQLDHPNIVRVFDERNQSDPPLRLLYMQFVGGGTLADCLKHVKGIPISNKHGRHLLESIGEHLKQCGLEQPQQAESSLAVAKFDWPTTVAWVGMQLAEGLDYSHRLKVIHRDVKPANIIMAADGTPKLVDFNVSFSGIAGRAGAAAFFGGSLGYMSPEQLDVANPAMQGMAAADLDGRADLFSLGIVLWEMLHGARPWSTAVCPVSWSDALGIEYELRKRPLPQKIEEAVSEKRSGYRVLDRALRQSLRHDRDQRPKTGRQMAQALRLAFHPQAARRLFPQFAERKHWLAGLPPWLVLMTGTLVPNVVAAIFNFIYNSSQIVSKYPELWPKFFKLSTIVNSIFFPIGIAASLWLIASFVRQLKLSSGPTSRNHEGVGSYWNLGHHVALICGALWLVAGFVFPLLLIAMFKPFHWIDALHFFLSLTICGGVAMVYPFFSLTTLNLQLYYPQTVSDRLHDPGFSEWSKKLRRLSRTYLLAAAAIPLFALSLLALTPNVPRIYLLATILTTAIGFGASFLAVQTIDDFVHDVEPFMNDDWTKSSESLH